MTLQTSPSAWLHLMRSLANLLASDEGRGFASDNTQSRNQNR